MGTDETVLGLCFFFVFICVQQIVFSEVSVWRFTLIGLQKRILAELYEKKTQNPEQYNEKYYKY